MEDLIYQQLEWVLPLLGSLLCAGLAWLGKKLSKKIENEWARGAMQRAIGAMQVSVRAIQESTVRIVKRGNQDGKLTEEEKKAIRAEAFKAWKEHLGKTGVKDFMKIIGVKADGLADAVNGLINASVYEMKREAKPELPFPMKPQN